MTVSLLSVTKNSSRIFLFAACLITSIMIEAPIAYADLPNGTYNIKANGWIFFQPSTGTNPILVYDGTQKTLALIRHNNAIYTAFSLGGIYRSPDGENLGGGGNTTTVYSGSQTVKAMISCQGSIFTAFSGKGIYRSPDGENLGGGGNTVKVYDGIQLVKKMKCNDGKVITTFELGGVYESPDGNNLGGGGRTVNLN